MLMVIDEYTREALSVIVANTMGLSEVLKALYPLLLKRGKPEYLRSDNALSSRQNPSKNGSPRWASNRSASFRGHLRGETVKKSLQWSDFRSNGYNERFNGTLRREVLNTQWFGTTRQAQTVINRWLKQYNKIRPHQALRMRPPAPETIDLLPLI